MTTLTAVPIAEMLAPAHEALGAIRKYLNSLDEQPQTLFPMSAKTVERLIQGYSKQALGFIISWHPPRTTDVSKRVELPLALVT